MTLLEILDYQLLVDVRNLRETIGTNVGEKRRTKNKMVNFDKVQLIDQIKNAIKQMSMISPDVEGIFISTFSIKNLQVHQSESLHISIDGYNKNLLIRKVNILSK